MRTLSPQANPAAYLEGESVVWWQFSSCTSQISVLSNPQFLGSTGDRTIFQILTSKGVDVSAFSSTSGEAEILLPAGTVRTPPTARCSIIWFDVDTCSLPVRSPLLVVSCQSC